MDKDVDPLSDATPLDDLSVSGTGPMTPGEEAVSYLPPGEAAAPYMSPGMESGAPETSWADEVERSGSAGAVAGGLSPGEGWSSAVPTAPPSERSRSFFGRREASQTRESGRIRQARGAVASPLEADGLPRYRLAHVAWMLAAMAAYCAFIVPQWSAAYIDFGDGNYMYIASRIAEGGVVYRDILAPQPPMHLFTGAGIIRMYEAVRGSLPESWRRDHPIFAFRAFSLLLHLATFLLVVRLGGRAWGRAAAGVTAGVVYMALPLTLWWSMGYQSEPLEVFFLVAMMNCALGGSRGGDLFAGILGALAAMTNATAAPFLLVLILYMGIVNWRRAVRIAVPSLLLAGAMTLVMEFYASGTFLRNAVLNQTGTYPPEGFADYALGKLRREGTDIFYREGLFIIAALLGLFRFVHVSPLNGEARGGLVWFCLATMASFLYVTKGGTVDYIFSLAGPAVAVMGAGLWVEVASFRGEVFDRITGGHRPLRRRLLESGIPRLVAGFFLALMMLPTLYFYGDLWTQRAFELPDLDHAPRAADGSPGSNVEQVAFWIGKYSKPGDRILAPPFYAVLTGRHLWGDYSEIFIWTIKDHNDRTANDPDGEGYRKTLAMADAIRNGEIPIVILELDQTGRLPEVMKALQKAYRPVLEEPYRTLNTRLGIFVPQDAMTGSAGSVEAGPVSSASEPAGGPPVAPPPHERVQASPPIVAEPIRESPPPAAAPVVPAPPPHETPPAPVDEAATLLLGERLNEAAEVAAPQAGDGTTSPSAAARASAPSPALDDRPTTTPVTTP